jgi:hypothetical protein
MYGVDVAATRLDTLDKRCLELVKTYKQQTYPLRLLEVGSGQGGLVSALRDENIEICATDIVDYGDLSVYQNHERIQFEQIDCRFVFEKENHYDILVAQRVLHYIPYLEAEKFLKSARQYITKAIFVSLTGADTAIARYLDVTRPIEERFMSLTLEGRSKFSIDQPITVYTQAEAKTLVSAAGFAVTHIRTTDFGNHQIVAI